MAVVVGSLVAAPAVAHGGTYTYDTPTIAHVDAHQFVATGQMQLDAARVASALPTTDARGTSTTPDRFVNATNTAGGLSDDALRALSTSEQRAVRSLQQQVADHTAKLEAYQANPAAYDNLGILERAPTAEIRQSIIDGRIRHLTNEMKAFQDQIDKLLGGAG